MAVPSTGQKAVLTAAFLPVDVDLSWLPVGTDVLLVLTAAWVLLRVALVWVWLRRRGHLEGVASLVPTLK